jgi:predicted S18 family serine protease
MHSTVINYNYDIESNAFAKDWGFYVDIESVRPNYPNNQDIIRDKYNVKNFKKFKNSEQYYKEICDEYEYHSKNYDESYSIDLNDVDIDLKKESCIGEKIINMVARITSTTLITASLTYLILFVL